MDLPPEVQDALNKVEAFDWAEDVAYQEGGRLCSVDGDEYLRLLDVARTLAYFVKGLTDGRPLLAQVPRVDSC